MEKRHAITGLTVVKNKLGMHARPASRIAQMAESAKAPVWLQANDIKVDAASILDILMLCAVKGTKVVVEAENPDDSDVLNQIVDFFENGFGEA